MINRNIKQNKCVRLGIFFLLALNAINILIIIYNLLCEDVFCFKQRILAVFTGMGIVSEILLNLFNLEFIKTNIILSFIVSAIILSPAYYIFGYLIMKTFIKLKIPQLT